MTKAQLKKTIIEILTPKYEESRISVTTYVQEQSRILDAYRKDFSNQVQTVNGVENTRWRNHYNGFYGYYDAQRKKQVEGTYFKNIPKMHRVVLQETNERIQDFYAKKFKADVLKLAQDVVMHISDSKPMKVEYGHDTEHDLHFIVTNKQKIKSSYTINTIVAGGLVQVLHNRTLKKFHKGVI